MYLFVWFFFFTESREDVDWQCGQSSRTCTSIYSWSYRKRFAYSPILHSFMTLVLSFGHNANACCLLLQTFCQDSSTLSSTNGRCRVSAAYVICIFSVTLMPSFAGRRSCTTAEQKIRTASRGQYHLLFHGLLWIKSHYSNSSVK